MNIFILDTNIELCAQYHCDKHVVKMITEHAQMLSTACRAFGLNVGYNSTHVNHPCSKWVRESIDNYLWLIDMTHYLHEEWRYRYGHSSNKYHKAYEIIETLPFPEFLPDIGLTPFAQAMPQKFHVS